MIILAIAQLRTSNNTFEGISVALLVPSTKDQMKGNGTEEGVGRGGEGGGLGEGGSKKWIGCHLKRSKKHGIR